MRNSRPIILFPLLCFLSSTISILCDPNTLVCNEKEKHALLRFKKALSDPGNRLSSWSVNQDCCRWEAVRCNNVTGRVVELHLGSPIPSFLGSMGSLRYLDLSFAEFRGLVPHQLGNLSTLRHLDLGSFDELEVHWLESVSMLPSLSELHLSECELDSNMTSSLGSLVSLSLPDNQFKGQISESLGQLKYLEYLSLSVNSFHGHIPTSIGNLSSLSWTPPFQLEYLEADSCKMGPKFPAWLQTQKSLFYLDVSRSGIVDTAPNWFWKFASYIQQIHLSNNQISGDLSQVVLNNTIIDLSSNCFSGRLPRLSPNVVVLNFANNSFSGQISPFMCQKMNGRSKLEVLDISINALSGELSDCWMHWPSLTHVSLGSNNLSGKIPNSMGSLVGLKALSLHNNSFYGDIPLITRELQGEIPKCLNNFSAMAAGPIRSQYDIWYDALEADYDYESYMESVVLDIKGRESEYKEILKYVRAIDLSSNNLSGSIPVEIFSFSGLQFLNLSCNHLRGMISAKIGGMEYLESLDLSRNGLSGEIPQSIANLTFLSYLNVSYNNFSGRIPSSTQLQSLDPLSFFGNAELCGAPLTKNCTKDEEPQDTNTDEESGEHPEIAWFYIGMGTGFVVGFWGVCGALFFKRAWRHAYFRVLDDMKDRVYVVIALRLKWLQNNLRRYFLDDMNFVFDRFTMFKGCSEREKCSDASKMKEEEKIEEEKEHITSSR
ncbi:Receptor like protein 30 [Vitis vinifera]|uniref:Receptor like protein 30 n=1 Tax=Vitis vinifera TaxID=29760 RepID=A0A438GQM2_VITVI|nr:Receptor like protein 30 [Vitis vinifera]